MDAYIMLTAIGLTALATLTSPYKIHENEIENVEPIEISTSVG